MEKHFDSIIFQKLSSIANEGNWEKMQLYLEELNNSRFRTASYLLAERILPELESEQYWKCFSVIAVPNTKVYLVTFLKAAVQMYKADRLTFANPNFAKFAQESAMSENSIDRQKTLLLILPILKSYDECVEVLQNFCGDNISRKLKYLINTDESIVSYYAIFQYLRQGDLPVTELSNYLNTILKRSTPTAYNFVSIMREYFGITSLRGQFSLSLKPYELSRLENNFDTFSSILKSIS